MTNSKRGRGCLLSLSVVLGVIGLLVTFGVASSIKSTAHKTTTTTLTGFADVSIASCGLDAVLHDPQAELTIVNHSSKTSNYIITVAFDAPDGSQFDSSNAAIQTLASGQSTSTKVTSLKDNAPPHLDCKVTDVIRLAS